MYEWLKNYIKIDVKININFKIILKFCYTDEIYQNNQHSCFSYYVASFLL